MEDFRRHKLDREARSHWSTHRDQQFVTVRPPQATMKGTIRLAGSKSLTNRALIAAALADGTSHIQGILKSDDSYWCIDCLTKLGVRIAIEGETGHVEGCGGSWPNRSGTLYVGSAGTVARFLPAALAIAPGVWAVTGSRRMSERPLAPLLDALAGLGAQIEHGDAARGSVPFTLTASGLRGGEVSLPGSTSSQYISGVLLAAPYAGQPLTVRVEGELVQRDYVEMTLDTMSAFGVTPRKADNGASIVVPTGRYEACSLALEPDVSACCYFWALAALTGGSIRTEGVDAATTRQPDIEMLGVLERMGCTVLRGGNFVEVHGPQQLKGGFTVSMQRWSDQTLTVAALAPFADGPITLTDAAHIRHHECDRLAAICTELRKLGIRADEHRDGLTIHPGLPNPDPDPDLNPDPDPDPVPAPAPVSLDTYDDHRMAMSLALIGAKAGPLRIADPGCVSKTCPDYFERLSALGIQVEYE